MKIGIEFKNLRLLPENGYFVEIYIKYITCYLLTICHDMETKPMYNPVVKKNLVWINSQETTEKLTLIDRVTAEINKKHFNYIKENINNDLGHYGLQDLMVYEIKEGDKKTEDE